MQKGGFLALFFYELWEIVILLFLFVRDLSVVDAIGRIESHWEIKYYEATW